MACALAAFQSKPADGNRTVPKFSKNSFYFAKKTDASAAFCLCALECALLGRHRMRVEWCPVSVCQDRGDRKTLGGKPNIVFPLNLGAAH